MDTNPDQRKVKKRFYFDQRWVRNGEIRGVIERAWGSEHQGSRMFKVTRKIRECRMALLTWKRNNSLNSGRQIMELKEKIQELKVSNNLGKRGQIAELKLQLSTAYREEELYWSQKARTWWLQEGDKNTAFFHASVMAARKQRKITCLQKDNGQWCKTDQELREEMCRYYNQLLTTGNVDQIKETLQGVPTTISRQMNEHLIRPVGEQEIHRALFSMHPNKSPGTDGMSPLFFQKYWHIVRIDVVNAVVSFFHTGNMLKVVNETLIPKVENPINLTQYRPISLCNTLYKIISKVLANRLKVVLNKCISETQSAFVPGRQIVDNVLIAHEVMHFLKNKRKGKVGFMTIKLDMSKAYDRVEWKFIGRMMMHMGFCPIFVMWIISCISSISYSFNLNGAKVGYIKPSRGLRQGGPLSPYLFLICAEGLSHLINTKIDKKMMAGIKVSKNSPQISHLFFADDSLICCKATVQEAKQVQEVLKSYSVASEQLVNFEKSAVYYSRNTLRTRRAAICEVMGNLKEATNGKYLGLPMAIGRTKNQVFGYIKSAVTKKMKGWANKMLSMAGKEEKKLPWVSWKKLADVKGRGGLGFKDLDAFNKALLAKQLWRIICSPNLLMSKVIRGNNLKDHKSLDNHPPNSASWAWKSIHSAWELLEGGLWKRVGDGTQINIWEDRWVIGSAIGRTSTTCPPNCHLHTVSQLISEGRWNEEILQQVFNREEREHIASIPLSVFKRQDRYFWNFAKSGIYTVKTGYARAMQASSTVNSRQKLKGETSREIRKHSVWKQLWNLNLKHKIKHFIWKCLQNGIAVNDDIYKRTGKGDKVCTVCGEGEETAEHMFFNCPRAQLMWKIARVRWEELRDLQSNLWRWWEAIAQTGSKELGTEHIVLTVNILWQIWKAWNKMVFEQQRSGANDIVQRAQQEWLEYEDVRQQEEAIKQNEGAGSQMEQVIVPRAEGVIRISTDAALNARMIRTGKGIVAQHWTGEIIRAKGVVEWKKGEALMEETLTIRLALQMAQETSWRKIAILSDCKTATDHIRCNNVQDGTLANILEDIAYLIQVFDYCTIS
ncbi:uncharacterized protein [Coffea arabica]|uniref:Reverse transcriptase domain-containing protein n=1 Tax=Coffea arabica TaxID=13443 RepID=A0A6P6VAW0_COFAR